MEPRDQDQDARRHDSPTKRIKEVPDHSALRARRRQRSMPNCLLESTSAGPGEGCDTQAGVVVRSGVVGGGARFGGSFIGQDCKMRWAGAEERAIGSQGGSERREGDGATLVVFGGGVGGGIETHCLEWLAAFRVLHPRTAKLPRMAANLVSHHPSPRPVLVLLVVAGPLWEKESSRRSGDVGSWTRRALHISGG